MIDSTEAKTQSSSLVTTRNTPDIIRTVKSGNAPAQCQADGQRGATKMAVVEKNREQVKAENVQKLLARQLAYLSGGMDECHPILTFPACSREALAQTNDADLSTLLLYFMQLTSGRDSHSGFTVLMDMRDVAWSIASAVATRLQGLSCVLVHQAFILRSSSLLNKLESLLHKSICSFRVTVVHSVKDLHRHIDPEELTSDFGGTLPYSHSEWINIRKHVERFVDGCDDVSTLLSILSGNISEVTKVSSLAEAKDRLVKTKENAETIQSVATKTLSEGRMLMHDMQHTEEMCPLLATWTCDYVDATWAVQERHEMLMLQSKAAVELLHNHTTDLEQCAVFHEFREQGTRVTKSLDEYFDQLTHAGSSIGSGSLAAQELLQQHIALEIDVQDMVPTCESVLQLASQFSAEHYAIDKVQQMAQKIESRLPEISKMVTERSSLLEKAVEFSTLVDQVLRWCNRGKNLLSHQCVDQALTPSGTADTLQQLNTFINSRVSLTRLQEVAKMIPGDVAQLRAAEALQKCSEVHELVENRKLQLNRISTTVRSLTPMGDGKSRSNEKTWIRKSQSLEHVSGDRESNAGHRDFQERSDEFTYCEVFSPEECRDVEIDMEMEQTDGQTEDLEDSEEDGIRQLLDDDDDETDGDILRKRVYILDELIETERVYIEDLRQVIEGYYNEMDPSDPFLPPYLRGKRKTIFGNLRQIYQFHNSVFLSELEQVETPTDLSKCFLYNKKEFGLYSTYCKNKVEADEFLQDCDQTFFHSCQKRLGHFLPLTAYLLKPVQRITKYQLLLKDMMNCCQRSSVAPDKLQESLSCMLMVLKHVNDAMHSIGIEGFRGSLIEQGSLLLQDSFRVWDGKDPTFKKEHSRQVFLYKRAVIFSKKRSKQKHANKTVYSFKNSIKVSELGLTETVEGHPCRFMLSQYGETERMFTLQAENAVVKQGWVEQIRRLLSEQLMHIRDLVSGQSGYPSVSSAVAAGFDDHSPLRKHPPDFPGRPSIHRHWSQDSIKFPPARELEGKTERDTADQSSREKLSIVVSKPDGEAAGEVDHSTELKSETASTTSGTSLRSTDSFDSADEWGDDDILDMDLAPNQPRTYCAIADFAYANDEEEISYMSLKTGDHVDVVRLGQGGWWFVRCKTENGHQPSSSKEGWVPASFLELVKEPKMTQQESKPGDARDGQETSPQITQETPV